MSLTLINLLYYNMKHVI